MGSESVMQAGRKGSKGGWTWVRLGLIAVLALPLTAGLGQVAPSSQGGVSPRPPFGNDPLHTAEPPMGIDPHKLEQMREEERHKRLEADTAKLVELTNELKSEVDKASKDELSLDVVRKATEIEKLAHDVRERMKS